MCGRPPYRHPGPPRLMPRPFSRSSNTKINPEALNVYRAAVIQAAIELGGQRGDRMRQEISPNSRPPLDIINSASINALGDALAMFRTPDQYSTTNPLTDPVLITQAQRLIEEALRVKALGNMPQGW